jgi:hypothetical protein
MLMVSALGDDYSRQLPPIGGEEQMDDVVFLFALSGEIVADHLSDGCGPV